MAQGCARDVARADMCLCIFLFLGAIDLLLVQIYCHAFRVLELCFFLHGFVCFLLVLPLVSLIEYDKLFG